MRSNWFPIGSLRRLVARNTVSQIIGKLISSFSIVVVSILIARQFGPEGYGDFVKITTYVGFFYLLSDFGLNAVFLQKTARTPTGEFVSDSWRFLLGIRMCISVLLVVIALGVLTMVPQGVDQGYTPLVRYGILLFIPVIIAQAIITSTNALFQKMLRYDYSTRAQGVGSFALLITALVFTYVNPMLGPVVGVGAMIMGSVMTAGTALYIVWRMIGTVTPKFSISNFASLLKESAPLGFALFFNLLYFHSDSVVLALTRTTQEVGIYGLAYKVFELPLVIPIFFMNSVYPLLLSATQEGARRQKKIFKLSFIFLLGASFIIGLGMWIGAPLLVLVRPDFAPSIEPLKVLILGLPIFFLSALFMWFIIAIKKQVVLVYIHGIAMMVNILGNIMLVPTFGYMASSWITIVSELIVLGVTMAYVLPRIAKEDVT